MVYSKLMACSEKKWFVFWQLHIAEKVHYVKNVDSKKLVICNRRNEKLIDMDGCISIFCVSVFIITEKLLICKPDINFMYNRINPSDWCHFRNGLKRWYSSHRWNGYRSTPGQSVCIWYKYIVWEHSYHEWMCQVVLESYW